MDNIPYKTVRPLISYQSGLFLVCEDWHPACQDTIPTKLAFRILEVIILFV